jgi:integrative and conjugative element protein (TIGR02256 family)
MHMQPVTAWISRQTLDLLADEAGRSFPLETGGALVGYWTDTETIVVKAIFGPGPDSHHDRYSYVHDHIWERSRIAEHYERSGRVEVYVGDWHTHPEAYSGNLSFTDRAAIKDVLRYSDARLSRSLMLIVFGRPHEWQVAIWVGQLRSKWRWPLRLTVEPIELREFD